MMVFSASFCSSILACVQFPNFVHCLDEVILKHCAKYSKTVTNKKRQKKVVIENNNQLMVAIVIQKNGSLGTSR